MTHITILNILIYFCLPILPILFLFKKTIMKPKWVCWVFLIELNFFSSIFFHIVKKIVLEKSHPLNFIKSINMFTGLVG